MVILLESTLTHHFFPTELPIPVPPLLPASRSPPALRQRCHLLDPALSDQGQPAAPDRSGGPRQWGNLWPVDRVYRVPRRGEDDGLSDSAVRRPVAVRGLDRGDRGLQRGEEVLTAMPYCVSLF